MIGDWNKGERGFSDFYNKKESNKSDSSLPLSPLSPEATPLPASPLRGGGKGAEGFEVKELQDVINSSSFGPKFWPNSLDLSEERKRYGSSPLSRCLSPITRFASLGDSGVTSPIRVREAIFLSSKGVGEGGGGGLSYKEVVIPDPFNYRSKIAEVGKGAKGVYIFEVKDRKNIYVGSSINLYNRVCSYFMPSILSKSDRRVLRYFNKHGFKNVILTLLILEPAATWEQVIELEQKYIDKLSSNLNIDLVAGGYNGYHTPMSPEAR